MEEIINIIVKLAVAVLLGVGLELMTKVREYLTTKKAELDDTKKDKAIAEFVNAAEQLFKNEDPDGSMRLNYVQNMAIEAGYDLTDALRAKIESYVLKLNQCGGEGK